MSAAEERCAEVESDARALVAAAEDARRLLQQGRPGEAADRLARARRYAWSVDGRMDDACAACKGEIG